MTLPTRIFPALSLVVIFQLQGTVEAVPVAATASDTADSVISCDVIIPGPPVTASTPGTQVTGLQLFHNGNTAILTSSGFNTAISFDNGGLGFFDGCHEWWLNVGSSANSYKPLSFGFDDEETKTWVASFGSVLESSSPRTSKFLACNEGAQWVLYLQAGRDLPPYGDCVETELTIGNKP